MEREAATRKMERDETAARLIDALNHDRFVLFQQPIVPIRQGSGDAPYQEILVRFQEEEEKLLPPGTFIPILESCRLMHLLDRWVVNRVIKWLYTGHKQHAGWSAPRCSINLSSDSLTDPEFPRFVKQQLHTATVDGRHLAFEIAEADAHRHRKQIEAFAKELHPLSCRFALTGYKEEFVSADELATLGIDTVKMDIDIVTTLHANPLCLEQAERLQSQCEGSGVCTVGEFVERKETLDHLKRLGVRYAQGYGIARPRPLLPQYAPAKQESTDEQ